MCLKSFRYFAVVAAAVLLSTASITMKETTRVRSAATPSTWQNKSNEVHNVKNSNTAIDIPRFVAQNNNTVDPNLWSLRFLHFDEERTVTLCTCAKCGSTSLYKTLYSILHGKSWDFNDPPWVHRLDYSQRWTNVNASRTTRWNTTNDSIAFVRDPKERIISAWKSKVGCHDNADGDRATIVPNLLDFAGMPIDIANNASQGGLCLDLSAFLQVLFHIHSQGKQGMVNVHFRPQHLHCFLHNSPSEWNIVTTIKSPDALCQLTSVIFGKDFNATSESNGGSCAMMKAHATQAEYNLTAGDEAILDAITREEYDILGPYIEM